MTDREFEGSRRALEAKRKDLRREGKGRRQNAAEALTEGDEKCLWESGQLGDDNPHTLIHTIWYLCTMHFGWRGVDEHRRVCYGDFELGCDDEGVEFVQFKVERGTKTRTGCEGQQERAFNPRMYAHGGENCPVNLFKTYISHRPPHTTKDDSPFYLQPANIISTRSNIWYKNQPVGINSLKKYMKTMTENAGISGKKTTNHSARKTMITKLVQNDTNPLHVAQLTGHKNIKSLDSYSVASKKQQRDMSHLISGVPAVKDITNTRTVCSSPSNPGVPLPSCSAGMTITGNNVVNIYFNQQSQSSLTCSKSPARKRRAIIFDDSDEQ